MANVKNAAIREIIIDRCLQDRKGYTVLQILKKCNAALELRGYREITSPNTILNDFVAISNRWHQNIVPERKGRNIVYHYEDRQFSIFKAPIGEQDIIEMYEALETLKKFESYQGFEWIEELSWNIRSKLLMGNDAKPVMAFDDNKQLRGMDNFATLHDYIRIQQPLAIKYQTYRSDKLMDLTVHPYFLKQYNSRWFLIAYNEQHQCISNYAIDRILSIDTVGNKFIPSNIDFTKYYSNVIGVSIEPDKEPVEVLLKIDAVQYQYVASKPLHHSQQLKETAPDGSAIVSLNVIPNYELKQQIMSLGSKAEVLQPESLRNEISEEISKLAEKYKLPQFD